MNENNGNTLNRIAETFNKELEEIRKVREERGIKKKHNSIRVLTDLITKHSYWKLMKEDIANYNFKDEDE